MFNGIYPDIDDLHNPHPVCPPAKPKIIQFEVDRINGGVYCLFDNGVLYKEDSQRKLIPYYSHKDIKDER